jgi:hypothetical protein
VGADWAKTIEAKEAAMKKIRNSVRKRCMGGV